VTTVADAPPRKTFRLTLVHDSVVPKFDRLAALECGKRL
jgi:hypothetical protein